MGMENQTEFSVREKFRRWKHLSGVFHLLTVSTLALGILWVMPQLASKSAAQIGQDMERQIERRQLLLEALDKIARYQHYYGEVNGRFTRDIARLALPADFLEGKQDILRRGYEISVLETRPGRFLLLATGTDNGDRVTVDESFRINANFVLPMPSRAFLLGEAERMLRLRTKGRGTGGGAFARYWNLQEDESHRWVAVGIRAPVRGERREANETPVSSLFTSVREQVQSRMMGRAERAPAQLEKKSDFKEILSAPDVTDWLESAHLAQHVYWREKGEFARRWEDLDLVTGLRFTDRMRAAKNVRVKPIEMTASGYQIVVEGTEGDLMGEQFLVDKSGSVRQLRYTESLIQQLQETTNILENFQINPIVDDPTPRYRP